MEDNYLIRLKSLLLLNYNNFNEIEQILDYLLDNSLFQEMSISEFLDFKSILKEFYSGKKLDKNEKKIICLENEYYSVNTESLADTQKRLLKWLRMEYLFWKHEDYQLIVAHSNSLRGLVKFLEKINDKEIENLSIPTGKPILFELDGFNLIQKKILSLPGTEVNPEDWIYKKKKTSIQTSNLLNEKTLSFINRATF